VKEHKISEGVSVYTVKCCNEVYGSEQKALAHERMCYKNKDNHACPTCGNLYKRILLFKNAETGKKEGCVCNECHIGNLDNHLYYEENHFKNRLRKNCKGWRADIRNHMPIYYINSTAGNYEMTEIINKGE